MVEGWMVCGGTDLSSCMFTAALWKKPTAKCSSLEMVRSKHWTSQQRVGISFKIKRFHFQVSLRTQSSNENEITERTTVYLYFSQSITTGKLFLCEFREASHLVLVFAGLIGRILKVQTFRAMSRCPRAR